MKVFIVLEVVNWGNAMNSVPVTFTVRNSEKNNTQIHGQIW